MMTRRSLAGLFLLLILVNRVQAENGPTAHRHVLDWKAQFVSNAAPGDAIGPMLVHDDGTGPALYVGGRFRAAGGKRVANLARWDGVSWTPLGAGLNGTVNELAVYQGKLIAGGAFTEAGGVPAKAIAQWDGSRWTSLGQGLATEGSATTDVWAMQVLDGGLYVAGRFSRAGGVPVASIARWDDGQWSAVLGHPLGGISDLADYRGKLLAQTQFDVQVLEPTFWRRLGGISGGINAIAVFADDLYMAGSFPEKVMRWTGSSWLGLPNDFSADADIESILVRGTGVTVFGRLEPNPSLRASVARWNGSSWVRLPGCVESMRRASLLSVDGALLAGGQAFFQSIDALLSWNGQRWLRPGSGLHGKVGPMLTLDGELLVGGRFVVEGATPIRNLAQWTDQGWVGFGEGQDGLVQSLLRFGDRLYLAGTFQSQGNAYGIAVWDGSTWVYELPDAYTSHLLIHDGNVLAFGEGFDPVTGLRTHAFRRTGQSWVTMSQGLTDTPVGAVIRQGQLLVAQRYDTFRWDGSVWTRMPALTMPIEVNQFSLHQGDLIFGGGQGAIRLYRWDGALVSPIESPGDGYLNSILSHDGFLYISADLGSAAPVPTVRRWNGAVWESVGGALGISGRLGVHAGELLVGGNSSTGTPIAAYGLAETSTVEIIRFEPQPAVIGEPVRIRVRVSGVTAPVAGVVSVTGAPGGACSVASLSPVSATSSEAECTIRWNTPGIRRVNASYTGGGTRSLTWQPSASAPAELQVLPPDSVFGSGFESVSSVRSSTD